MFNKIFAWLIGAEQTVENILNSWFASIEKLEALATSKFEEEVKHNVIIAEAENAAAQARRVGQEAAEVAERIKSVIQGVSSTTENV